MDGLPEKLEWRMCQCGHKSCARAHPINLGHFYQGTGFEPNERAAIDEAWGLLIAKKKEQN